MLESRNPFLNIIELTGIFQEGTSHRKAILLTGISRYFQKYKTLNTEAAVSERFDLFRTPCIGVGYCIRLGKEVWSCDCDGQIDVDYYNLKTYHD